MMANGEDSHLDSTWIVLSSLVCLEVFVISPKVSHIQSIFNCTVTKVARELMLVKGIRHDSKLQEAYENEGEQMSSRRNLLENSDSCGDEVEASLRIPSSPGSRTPAVITTCPRIAS